jgi:hypothetical protein
MLKEGNARFVAGKSLHPHSDATRNRPALKIRRIRVCHGSVLL